MSFYSSAPDVPYSGSVAQAGEETRASFIGKTYLHLLGAIVVFLTLELMLLLVVHGNEDKVLGLMFGLNGYAWLIVLGLFMVVSWIAHGWAASTTSLPMQYAGLGLYVVAQSVIFLPLIIIAAHVAGPLVIPTAGLMTAIVFGGLTAVVFLTRWNFNFLRVGLGLAGIAALGFIVCSIVIGFNLGILFTVLMIVFASAYILYDTSNVLHTFRPGQHVAASLALFASVALLFWYMIRLVMAFSSDD